MEITRPKEISERTLGEMNQAVRNCKSGKNI